MVEKICTSCKNVKFLDGFPEDKKMSDGRSSWCRSCFALKTKEYRTVHPKYDAVAKKKWADENVYLMREYRTRSPATTRDNTIRHQRVV